MFIVQTHEYDHYKEESYSYSSSDEDKECCFFCDLVMSFEHDIYHYIIGLLLHQDCWRRRVIVKVGECCIIHYEKELSVLISLVYEVLWQTASEIRDVDKGESRIIKKFAVKAHSLVQKHCGSNVALVVSFFP